MNHFGLMVLYSALVSSFFSLLWRRDVSAQRRLFLQIFLGMLGGALVLGWLMYLAPVGPPGLVNSNP
jgi:hypothetical protein